MTVFWFAVLVSIIIAHLSRPCQSYEEVLAAQNATFSATNYNESTIFNAPQNGSLAGIKLHHVSGFVSCSVKESPNTNWGCFPDASPSKLFFTVFLRVDNAQTYNGTLYYPTAHTKDVTISGLTHEPIDTSRGCTLVTYTLNDADPVDSTDITLLQPDYKFSYEVSIDDKFMLQFTEACTQYNNEDNAGIAKVDVYFVYHVSTDPPTSDSPSPTRYPTRSPTLYSYGVNIWIKYTLQEVNITHLVTTLTNNAHHCVSNNLTEQMNSQIMDMSQNITNQTTGSLSIRAIIDTYHLPPAIELADKYNRSLQECLITLFNQHSSLIVLREDNVFVAVRSFDLHESENQVVQTTTTATATSESTPSAGKSSASKKKPGHLAGVILTIILLVLFGILLIWMWMKRKREKAIAWSNDEMQTHLLQDVEPEPVTRRMSEDSIYAEPQEGAGATGMASVITPGPPIITDAISGEEDSEEPEMIVTSKTTAMADYLVANEDNVES